MNDQLDHPPAIAERIKYLMLLRGFKATYAAAKDLGLATSTLQNIIKRNRISRATAERIAVKWGVSPNWIESGEGPKPTKSALFVEKEAESETDLTHDLIIPTPLDNASGEYIFIPRSRAILTRSGETYIATPMERDVHAFRRDWIASKVTSILNLVLFDVVGDSMSPIVGDGDLVLVDTKRKDLRYGKIFAIRVEQHVMVKILDLLANGRIRVVSQNRSDHPDYCIEPEELVLLGQVIWCSRTLA